MTQQMIERQDREFGKKLMKTIESEKKLSFKKILHILELNAWLSK